MRNVIKRIANIVFVVVVLLLAAYTFLMAKYPEETAQITGHRLYAVLTDSMEPRKRWICSSRARQERSRSSKMVQR